MNIKVTKKYIYFYVKSHSRDIEHEVIFNRITGEWSCTCEDYWYRKHVCKHVSDCRNILNALIFECSSNKAYSGETISGEVSVE